MQSSIVIIYKCISFIPKNFKILYQQLNKSHTHQSSYIYVTHAGPKW